MMKKARTVPLKAYERPPVQAEVAIDSRDTESDEKECGLDYPYFEHKRHGEREQGGVAEGYQPDAQKIV